MDEEPTKGFVLVVDDEDGVRRVLARMLRRIGYEVLEAADGAEGIEQYRLHGEGVRLVLLDMTMPKMTGQETLSRILALDGNARVVMMSGYADNEKGESPEVPGLLGFLLKPIQLAQLNRWLEEAQPG